MTNSERRVALVRKRASTRPARRCPTGRSSRASAARSATARRSRGVAPPRSTTSTRRTTAGRLCDQTGSRTSGCGARAPSSGRCPRAAPTARTRRHRAALRGAALPDADGRARLAPTPHAEPADAPDADFPLVLTTGRVADQWHTMTRTGKSPRPARPPSPSRSSSCTPRDAERAGVADGERVRVRSRRGRGDAARAGQRRACPRASRSRRSTGARCTARRARGALNARRRRARRPGLQAGRAEGVAPSASSRCRAARGRAPAARRARRLRRRRRRAWPALATVEALLAHDAGERWEVTIVGAEPERPYNRVLLSQALAGDASASASSRCATRVVRRPRRRRCALGVAVRARRPGGARRSELADGERLAYDALVLATGSRPFAAAGPRRSTCRASTSFRTRADARAILGGGRRARAARS